MDVMTTSNETQLIARSNVICHFREKKGRRGSSSHVGISMRFCSSDTQKNGSLLIAYSTLSIDIDSYCIDPFDVVQWAHSVFEDWIHILCNIISREIFSGVSPSIFLCKHFDISYEIVCRNSNLCFLVPSGCRLCSAAVSNDDNKEEHF